MTRQSGEIVLPRIFFLTASLMCLLMHRPAGFVAQGDEGNHGNIRVEGKLDIRPGGQAMQAPLLEAEGLTYQLVFHDHASLLPESDSVIRSKTLAWKEFVDQDVVVEGTLEVRVNERTNSNGGIVSRTNHYIHVRAIYSVANDLKRRRTNAVTVNKASERGVVEVRTKSGGGSAFVIDSRGFAVTNRHVVSKDDAGIAIQRDGNTLPFRVIGRGIGERHDLAIILILPDKPMTPLNLGRSNDLMVGEEVFAIANPKGLHCITRGIISRIDNDDAGRPRQVWTDADIFGGSSGGPILNARGDVVAVIKGGIGTALNYGLSVGELRRQFEEILSVEARFDFWFGAQVDTVGPVAKVLAVASGSPAEAAGIHADDIIIQLGKEQIHDGVDFYLSLVLRRAGDELPILAQRGNEHVEAKVVLDEYPTLSAVEADETTLRPGLSYAVFRGNWDQLPDFPSLEASDRGVLKVPGLPDELTGKDEFAIKISGFIKVAEEDLYTVSVRSDDGSRLSIGDRVVVDNDGLHGSRMIAGRIRLEAGLHPIEICHFDQLKDEELEVHVHRADAGAAELSAADFFHIDADP